VAAAAAAALEAIDGAYLYEILLSLHPEIVVIIHTTTSIQSESNR
jgi:hypothetical protein